MDRIPRQITYTRYEYTAAVVGEDDTVHTGTLLTFVYDIPYFGACGIFPPLHIANEIFSSGTAGGGMSPGTKWKPFTISAEEYAALVEAVQQTPIWEIRPYARYAFLPLKLDHSFDNITDLIAWFRAACQKHRDQWHTELKKAGAMSEL